jgi:enoyl-CoA hydratase/carnithine racemase
VATEVVCEIGERRASLVLNRPQKLNALNVALVTALEEQARHVSGRADVDVVVLRGAGRSFCAGLDLDMFAADGMSREFYRRQEGGFRLLELMDKTVIAAIHGHCLGGGVQLTAACDVRIASSDAILGLPAIDEGLFPGMAPFRLPRLLGRGRAASLILSGRRLGAEEAYAIGLVDHVVAADRFEQDLAAVVDMYARAPRAAAAAAKRLIARSYEASFDEVLAESEALLDECLRSTDGARARAARGARIKRR